MGEQADNEAYNDRLRAALDEAINQAKAERSRPLRKELYRKELIRLMKIFACLYSLEHSQTQNIAVRRDLEKLEATVFINRKSVDVEMSRERVMNHRREVWQQIEAVMDLLGGQDG